MPNSAGDRGPPAAADAAVAPAPVHVTFTEAEAVAALMRFHHRFAMAERAANRRFFNSLYWTRWLFLAAYVAALLAAARYDHPDAAHVLERTVPGIVVIVLWLVYAARSSRRHALLRSRYIFRSGSFHFVACDVAADGAGLSLRGGGLDCRYGWPLFSGIDRSGGILTLLMGSSRPIWIPERCFDGDPHRDAFVAFIAGRIAAPAAGPGAGSA